MDYSYESEEYNYLQQSWYTEIMAELENGKKLFWSKPYYEDLGARTLMTTVGSGIYIDGKLIGLSTVDWRMDDILNEISKIKPTSNSFALFADKINDYIIAYAEPDVDKNTLMGKSLKNLPWYSENLAEGKVFDYKGKKYIPYIKQLDNGMFLIVNVPLAELFHDVLRNLCILLAFLLLSSALIALILYKVLRRNINEPISKLTETAQEISRGDLDKTIFLKEPSELVKLANSFNKMKMDIKTQLTELSKISLEKEKMASELAIAKSIQNSALPKDFPQDECFELVASMTPAREVGGDFYDFFPIDENHYAFVIADVSGKGITAALYMMSAKTAIKNMLQAGYDIEDAINRANKTICENNVEGMFVTAFIGIIDLTTGEVQYINAGHCSPLLKDETGYKYFNTYLNLVLGAFAEYRYKSGSFKMEPGNRLFLYTDGITEAQTKEFKMYGEERLKKTLNLKEMSLANTLSQIHKSVRNFAKGAPQSDDVTMLALEFHHKK
jgi:sigma-B regulation protein RsbU (phosphoserine phosphatase)